MSKAKKVRKNKKSNRKNTVADSSIVLWTEKDWKDFQHYAISETLKDWGDDKDYEEWLALPAMKRS